MSTTTATQNTATATAPAACNCLKPAPEFPEQVTGMYILAEALKRLGLDKVYGLSLIHI